MKYFTPSASQDSQQLLDSRSFHNMSNTLSFHPPPLILLPLDIAQERLLRASVFLSRTPHVIIAPGAITKGGASENADGGIHENPF